MSSHYTVTIDDERRHISSTQRLAKSGSMVSKDKAISWLPSLSVSFEFLFFVCFVFCVWLLGIFVCFFGGFLIGWFWRFFWLLVGVFLPQVGFFFPQVGQWAESAYLADNRRRPQGFKWVRTRKETYCFRSYEPLTQSCQEGQLPELVITQLQNHFY